MPINQLGQVEKHIIVGTWHARMRKDNSNAVLS